MESLSPMKVGAGALIIFAAAASPIEAAPSTRLAAGARFRDCDRCPEMIVAPTGKFTIGSPPDEAGRRSDEGPQREIRIAKPFAVGRYEVTRRQYEAFLRDTGYPVSGNCMSWGLKEGGMETVLRPKPQPRHPDFSNHVLQFVTLRTTRSRWRGPPTPPIPSPPGPTSECTIK